ncbi:MAG: anti-sigma factor [Planctomycetes bacterium]|nr:anti-sigma factor [Planctomycetota bacterium]
MLLKVLAGGIALTAAILGVLLKQAGDRCEDVLRANERLHQDLDVQRADTAKLREQLDQSTKDHQRQIDSLTTSQADLAKARFQLDEARTDLARLRKTEELLRDPSTRVFTLRGSEGGARVACTADKLAVLSALPPAAEGKTYRLWMFVTGRSDAVFAATCDTHGSLLLDDWKAPETGPVDGFALSLESGTPEKPTAIVATSR